MPEALLVESGSQNLWGRGRLGKVTVTYAPKGTTFKVDVKVTEILVV